MNDIFNFLVASAFVKLCSFFYLSKRWKKVNVGKITELRFYPIKSCKFHRKKHKTVDRPYFKIANQSVLYRFSRNSS